MGSPYTAVDVLPQVLAFFAAALVGLHVALVYWWPLSQRGWKKADYLWISLSLAGVLGATTEIRKESARGLADGQRRRVQAAMDYMTKTALPQAEAPYYCEAPGPGANMLGDLRLRVCDWARQISERLPRPSAGVYPRIDRATLPPSDGLSQGNVTIEGAVNNVEDGIRWYNAEVDNLEQLRRDAERSDGEWDYLLVSPYLLALGMALRITKTTGELRASVAELGKITPKRRSSEADAGQ